MEGLPTISPTIGLCEKYILGKMNQKKFPKDKTTRVTQPLQLVHSDLISPFSTKSLGGVSYVLTFIDDFSKMIFDYLLEYKDQTFNRFKYFKALVEK